MVTPTAIGCRRKTYDFLQYFASNAELPVKVLDPAGGSVASLAEHGGGIRLASGGADADAVAVVSPRNLRPAHATFVAVTALLEISNVGKAAIFFGLVNADDRVTPVENENGALTSHASVSDLAGILLEGEQDHTFQRVAKRNGDLSPLVALGDGEDAALDQKMALRFVAWKDGLFETFINGRRVSKTVAYYRPDISYGWILAVQSRATNYNVDLDVVHVDTQVGQTRTPITAAI